MVGLHYDLRAYILGKAHIQPSPFGEGSWATFTQIFQKRPDGCRFAVAQMVPLKVSGSGVVSRPPSGPFVVWDMFDDLLVKGKRTGPSGLLMPPPPLWMGETEDGMVMKALMLFDT